MRHYFLIALAISLSCAAGIFLYLSVIGASSAALWEFPLDDCWIHLVYMRGLIEDGLPTYNPGIPEAGFSSPLWLVLGLPFYGLGQLLGLSPVLMAKIASLLFAVVAAMALSYLVQELGLSHPLSLLAGPVLLLQPTFAFSAVSGTEVTLATAAIILALLASKRRRYLTAGVMLGAAGLARPESAVVGLVVVVLTAIEPAAWLIRLRRLLRMSLPPLLMALAWVAYNLRVTGFPLPNTFYVKSASDLPLLERLEYYGEMILTGGGILLTLVTGLIMVVGALALWRRPANRSFAVMLGLSQALTLSAILAIHPLYPQVRFYLQRYFYPYTALDGVLATLGLVALLSWRPGRLPALGHRIVQVLLLVALAACWMPAMDRARDEYAANCADIDRLHTAPALWIARNTPPDAVIAVEGAGSARFNSGRFTLDLLGLNYHPLAHATGDNALRTCLIVGHRPSFFLVPRDWLPELAPAFDLWTVEEFSVDRWSMAGGQVDRTVVATFAQLRPRAWERCRQRYGGPEDSLNGH